MFLSSGKSCQDVIWVTTPGIATSPGHPGLYGNNLNCLFIFAAQNGYRVKIEFTSFNLESCGHECCDWIQVKVFVFSLTLTPKVKLEPAPRQ